MVLELSTKDKAPEVAREDLFAVDGVMYTIPAQCPATEGVRYLNDVKSGGVEYAVSRLLHRMVGSEGMQALATCEALTPTDFKKLVSAVQRKVDAMMEEVKGN